MYHQPLYHSEQLASQPVGPTKTSHPTGSGTICRQLGGGYEGVCNPPNGSEYVLLSVPPPSYSKSCVKPVMSQVAMDECAASQARQLQAELGNAVRVESKVLGSRAVFPAEATWQSFLGDECTAEEKPFRGGSIVPLIYGECEIRLLMGRISDIRTVVTDVPHAGVG